MVRPIPSTAVAVTSNAQTRSALTQLDPRLTQHLLTFLEPESLQSMRSTGQHFFQLAQPVYRTRQPISQLQRPVSVFFRLSSLQTAAQRDGAAALSAAAAAWESDAGSTTLRVT